MLKVIRAISQTRILTKFDDDSGENVTTRVLRNKCGGTTYDLAQVTLKVNDPGTGPILTQVL
jgi:hypothetical protein